MLKKLHMDKLSIQILFFISLLILASIAGTALFSINSMRAVVDDLKQTEVKTSLSMLEKKLTDIANNASKAASMISADNAIINAIASKSIQAAEQHVADDAKMMGIDYLTITDKSGIVLIRMHDQNTAGDNLSQQQDISTALGGSHFSGIINEKSSQFSIVAAAPVIDSSGTVIGAVSVAFPLGSTNYLDDLKAMTGNDFTVFSGDVRLSTTIMQDGKRVIGTKLSSVIAETVISKKTDKYGPATILDESYLTAYRPILSPGGTEAIGVLFSGTKVTEIEKTYSQNILYIVIGGVILASIFDLIAFILVTRKINRPLLKVVKAAEGIENGDIALSLKADLPSVKSSNEIGVLARSMEKAVYSIERIAADTDALAAAVASFDLSVEINASVHQGIYKRIIEIVSILFKQLHDTITNIGVIAEQVSDGSAHLSDGSQALSRGATEQAGSIQELFASVSLVSDKAEKNADSGQLSTGYINQAAEGVRKSNDFMKSLLDAMNDINSSSEKISKIIKIIDDISFQTNILALNAAVEAARAGAAGKGFSVVADEVRMLATKSAEAAKQTTELITETIVLIKQGTKLAHSTASALSSVQEKAVLVEHTNTEITTASSDQAAAIYEIKQRLNAISSVVQNNTATAEESASISEELSAQAEKLYEEITKYKI